MTLVEQLPALAILIPLLSAPVIVLINRQQFAWLFSVTALAASVISAYTLLKTVLTKGTQHYYFGNWQPPWGISYEIDLLSAILLLLVAVIALLTLIFARYSIVSEIAEHHRVIFYALMLLAIAGLCGISVSGDLFNLFVFLEISSLASYALISLGKKKQALNAAFKYLVMGTIGATFYLIGVGFLYMQTGTLNIADLAQQLPQLYELRSVRAGFAFLTVGIGLKLALFPLHLWLPNAYAYAPSVVTVLLAATATKVAVYVLLRILLGVFEPEFSLQQMPLNLLLMLLGSLAIISCSLVAIFQTNIKSLLAYSSVAQLGYITLGIGFANATGLSAALVHLVNHSLMKAALFMAVAILIMRHGIYQLDQLKGCFQRMPITCTAIIIAGLSLIGIPGTVGFVSKWQLVQASLEAGYLALTIVIMLGSIMALIYIWKMVELMLFSTTEQSSRIHFHAEAPLLMLIPTWLLVIANLYFGINSEFTLGFANQAIAALSGG